LCDYWIYWITIQYISLPADLIHILHDVARNSNPWIKKTCQFFQILLTHICNTTQTNAFIPFMSFYIPNKQYNKPRDLRLQQCQNIPLMYLPSLPALAMQCLKAPVPFGSLLPLFFGIAVIRCIFISAPEWREERWSDNGEEVGKRGRDMSRSEYVHSNEAHSKTVHIQRGWHFLDLQSWKQQPTEMKRKKRVLMRMTPREMAPLGHMSNLQHTPLTLMTASAQDTDAWQHVEMWSMSRPGHSKGDGFILNLYQ